MKEIRKMGVLLFVICAVAAALLAMTNAVTAPKIAENAEKKRWRQNRWFCLQGENFRRWMKLK